jgi:MFS family permease
MKMNETDNKIENLVGNQNNNVKGVNNNHEDFKMDIKPNSENDPLTGSKILTQKLSAFQRFRHRIATPNIFMAVFLLAYVFQGTYFTYFVSVMTTIEKVFHISSSWIAIMLNFSEIGQICTSLTLTYYAGRGHRPRLIAIGTMIFSIAAFVSLLPHFIFYSTLYKTDLTTTNNSTISNVVMNNQTSEISWGQCLEKDKYNNLSSYDNGKMSKIATTTTTKNPFKIIQFFFCLYLDVAVDCSTNFEDSSQQPSLNTKIQSIVFVTFSVSLLFIGIGQTALATLGIPYIDDNVKSAQSATYIAITIGVRILGPLLGYYLGSYCTTISVDLSQNVNTIDNNFIGAWWLGK